MGKFIIKLKDPKSDKEYYLLWSTIVDAPVSRGMGLKEFKHFYVSEYGSENLEERLRRVELKGSSGYPPWDDVGDFILTNKAGTNDVRLPLEKIIEEYCN